MGSGNVMRFAAAIALAAGLAFVWAAGGLAASDPPAGGLRTTVFYVA